MIGLLRLFLASLTAPFKANWRLEAKDLKRNMQHDVFGAHRHLRRILQTYARYSNAVRIHWSPDKVAPALRPVRQIGNTESHVILGKLCHHYIRI
jgi:hypothetical protein